MQIHRPAISNLNPTSSNGCPPIRSAVEPTTKSESKSNPHLGREGQHSHSSVAKFSPLRGEAAPPPSGHVSKGTHSPSDRSLESTRSSPAGVEIVEVFTASHRKAFIDLPWEIYRHDPLWAPPLKCEVARFIDRRRHPFFQHGDGTHFLALRNGQAVGRICVSDDPRCNAAHGENLGCFGMFESIDDQQVADGLLAAASNWLAQRGRNLIRGPIDYSLNYPCGLLIDGFDTPPRVMMNHQPPYYQRLLEAAGLTKAKDLYAWWYEDTQPLSELTPRFQRLAERFRVSVRPLRPSDLQAEMKRCRHIYAAAWEDTWQSVPLSDAEFAALAKNLRRVSRPDFTLLAEVDGKPVGLVMLLPDVNEAARPLNGRLTRWGLPIGLARLWWRLRKVKTARLALLGVERGYRRRGVAELLILQVMHNAITNGSIANAELSWTLEDNALVNNLIQRSGGRHYKTYRIYERAVPSRR